MFNPKPADPCDSALLLVLQHPWPHGHVFLSPGSQFSYRVVGPCCRLFDRDQLPWPCCRLQWHGKEPSWRRIGRRYTPDLSAKRYPSYEVELLGYSPKTVPFVVTLYTCRLTGRLQEWWYAKPKRVAEGWVTSEDLSFERP